MNFNSLLEINTILSIIELTLLIITIIYGKKTLDSTVLTRRMQLLREIITEIGSDDIRQLRSLIYTTEENDLNMEDIRKLAVAYDRMAFLLLQDEKTLLLYRKFQGNEVVFLWEKIKNKLIELREIRKNPEYCKHFEELNDKLIKLDA